MSNKSFEYFIQNSSSTKLKRQSKIRRSKMSMENFANRYFGGDENFSSDFHLCFFILKFLGLWQNGRQSWRYFIFGFTLQFLYVFCFIVLQFIHTINNRNTFVDTSESLGLEIVAFLSIAKFLNFFLKLKLIEKLFKKLKLMKSEIKDLSQVRSHMNMSLKILKFLLRVQLIGGSGYIIGASIKQHLPIWIPFACSSCSVAYTLGILHLFLNTAYLTLVAPCINFLPLMFMISAIGLLKGLAERLKSMGNTPDAEKELIECIKHHLDIKEYIDGIQKSFGVLIFCQNLSGTFITCLFSIIIATVKSS